MIYYYYEGGKMIRIYCQIVHGWISRTASRRLTISPPWSIYLPKRASNFVFRIIKQLLSKQDDSSVASAAWRIATSGQSLASGPDSGSLRELTESIPADRVHFL